VRASLKRLADVESSQPPEAQSMRLFDYRKEMLPNSFLQQREAASHDLDSAIAHTGLSIGYPAWNLLYYSLLCSLPRDGRQVVVVETGTNHGFSTIVLAQALKDLGLKSRVRTVDIDGAVSAIARENVARAGLQDWVEFHVENSLRYLSQLVREVDSVQFAFLDGDHRYEHVCKEFSVLYPSVVAARGKVYFDNTKSGGVALALRFIRKAYGGNLIEFPSCSWRPPGEAIWQPS
jgi:predicted O-methyltransferase YrrM